MRKSLLCILSVLFLFSSCSKTELETMKVSKVQQEEKSKKGGVSALSAPIGDPENPLTIATEHNYLVDQFRRNNYPQLYGLTDLAFMQEVAKILAGMLKTRGYSSTNIDYAVSTLNRKYANLVAGATTRVLIVGDTSDVPAGDPNYHVNRFLNNLEVEGRYTSSFLMLVKKTIGNRSDSTKYTLHLGYLRNATYTDTRDLKGRDVYLNVDYKSGEYWRLRPGSSTIIADAVGALWGLPLGGVGSIIYGAAFSLYENEILTPGGYKY